MANRENQDERGLGEGRGSQRDVASEARGMGASGSSSSSNGSRRSNRGFASMDTSKQREIASKGGRAAHAKGTAHEFDSSEAREAGRKGGMAVSRNREHMAAIGRKGGEARGAKNAAARAAQQSTGTSQGATQNTGAVRADREVNIAGAAQNTGGSSESAFGGERRPAGNSQRENRLESH